MMSSSSCAGTLNYKEMDITFAVPTGGDAEHVSKRQKVVRKGTPCPEKCKVEDDPFYDDFEEIDLHSDDGSDHESDSGSFETISLSSDDDSDSSWFYDEDEVYSMEMEPLSRQVAREPSFDIPSGRSYVSNAQAMEIRNMHSLSLLHTYEVCKDTYMLYIGASPCSSHSPSACSTPAPAAAVNASDRDWTDEAIAEDVMFYHDDIFAQVMAEVAEPTTSERCYDNIFEHLMDDIVPAPASPKHYHDDAFAQVMAELEEVDDPELFALSDDSEPSTPTRGDGSYCYPNGHLPFPKATKTKDVLIDPYDLPEDAPPCNVREDEIDHPYIVACLANSGVNYMTEYEVVNSPRQTPRTLDKRLRNIDFRFRHSIANGCLFSYPDPLPIQADKPAFTPFSYTSVDQPRTRIARLMEGEPVSPKTRVPTAVMWV